MSSKIYLVTSIDPTVRKLVRAANRAQALSHVARSYFKSRVAGQDELVLAVQDGVPIEGAGEPEPHDIRGLDAIISDIRDGGIAAQRAR